MKSVPFRKYSEYQGQDRVKYTKGIIWPTQGYYLDMLEPNTTCYYMKSSGSAFERVTQTTLSGNLKYENFGVDKHTYSMGDRVPFDPDTRKQPLSNVTSNFMKGTNAPDMGMDELGLIEDLPLDLEDREVFEDTNRVAHHYIKRGNRSNSAQKRNGLDVRNAYEIKKEEFEDQGLINAVGYHWFSKKEQSRLVTMGIVTDDGLTHEDICREGSVADLRDLVSMTHTDKWWRATGIPRDISKIHNKQTYVLYGLENYDGDIDG